MTQAAILAASGSPGTTTGFKNKIINGAMVIDQRNAGASTTPTASAFNLDRWNLAISQASKLSVQQTTTAPVGFTNSVLLTSTSAYTVLSGDYFIFRTFVEGYNMADLNFGSVNAKTVTLSFWVRSSLTGNFGGSLRNASGNRSYPFLYAINAANTWEQKSVTITGCPDGTWDTTNGRGFELIFGMGVGSTYLGTAGAWTTADANSATGSTNVVSTNGATWYMTGAQLEVGTTATNFDFRSYGTELSLCQRYYETMGFGLLGIANSATGIWAQIIYKVQKRANPTIGLYTTTQTWSQFGVADRTSSSVSIGDAARLNTWGSITRIEGFSSITTNAPLGCNTDTVFTLSAEL